MRYCPYCGTQIAEEIENNISFCPSCGKRLSGNTDTNKLQSDEEHSSKPVKRKKGTILWIILIVLVFIVVGIFVIQRYGASENSHGNVLKFIFPSYSFSEDTKAIEERSNSVVLLECYDKDNDLYATGSGFVIFEDNVIATNYHVIEQEVYSISAQTESGKTIKVTGIIAYDKDKDIALLKTSTPSSIEVLGTCSSETLKKGEKVVAIGSPLGLTNSVSMGVFSGLVEEDNQKFLQFTAPISPGSSGGALFNDSGEVIGVTSSSFTEGQNINLAIPIEQLIELWENRKERDFLSVKDFYETFVHTLDVSYVLSNRDILDGQRITVGGYISFTHNYVYEGELNQKITLVSEPSDVIDYSLKNDQWTSTDYEHSSKYAEQLFDGIILEVHLNKDWDKDEFSASFAPGQYITFNGIFDAYEIAGISSNVLNSSEPVNT